MRRRYSRCPANHTSQPRTLTALPRPSPAKTFRHKAQRTRAMISPPKVKARPFTGRIRKNQRRTEYFA